MIVVYLQAPTLLGIGRITVTVELPRSGGLYRFSNVTYRGVQVGKVTDIKVVGGDHVQATVSLEESAQVPADSQAVVRSVSAVGEQFIDLQPPTAAGPFLHDGSVIALGHTSVPQQVGPMLDQVNALVASIPKDRLGDLLGESFTAFNGAGEDFGSLLDSSSGITGDLNRVADQSRNLIDRGAPLLDTQVATSDALRVWARALSGVSDQLVRDDPQVRTLLQTGPGFADEAARLLRQVKPTLPVLLANLTTIGQVGVTYRPSLEQLLVCCRPAPPSPNRWGPPTTPPASRWATSRCPSPTHPRVPSDSCRPRSGGHRPTKPMSIPPTACTASCPRTPRSRCAAPATIRVWGTRASGRRRCRSATATSLSFPGDAPACDGPLPDRPQRDRPGCAAR